MNINTEHFDRCVETLEQSLALLQQEQRDSVRYDVYRHAVLKGFELVLELSGKLLRKALKAYTGSSREIDALFYKDVFRHSAKHGLLRVDEVERWFEYRDNRNQTTHDYGEHFAEQTLKLISSFISDAKSLSKVLSSNFGAGQGD